MLINNINAIKAHLPKSTLLCAVVKANGYGLGASEIVQTLRVFVDYFAVATIEERESLGGQISVPAMILSPLLFFEIPTALKKNYEFTVGSISQLNDCICIAKKLNIVPKIHLKVDSGMHRFGFDASSFLNALDTCHCNNVEVKSVYSHFLSTDKELVLRQKKLFDSLTASLKGKCICHISASFGATCNDNLQIDMVRCGLAMIGTDVFLPNIKCVVELSAFVIDIKVVAFGDFVGYNYCNQDKNVTRIAVVRIGYGDGFSRSNSKVGVMYIGDAACKIIGNVCMDVCFLDVSFVQCKIGDVVKIIRFENADDVSVLAKNQKTIPYEITTALSQRVKRIFID